MDSRNAHIQQWTTGCRWSRSGSHASCGCPWNRPGFSQLYPSVWPRTQDHVMVICDPVSARPSSLCLFTLNHTFLKDNNLVIERLKRTFIIKYIRKVCYFTLSMVHAAWGPSVILIYSPISFRWQEATIKQRTRKWTIRCRETQM